MWGGRAWCATRGTVLFASLLTVVLFMVCFMFIGRSATDHGPSGGSHCMAAFKRAHQLLVHTVGKRGGAQCRCVWLRVRTVPFSAYSPHSLNESFV